MADYIVPGMRLYLEQAIDWESQFRHKRGSDVDVEAEVGAVRTVLETAASIIAEAEQDGREHWAENARLTDDGGAEPPPHIRAGLDRLREAGLVSLMTGEDYGGYAMPHIVNAMIMEMLGRANASMFTIWGLQTGIAQDIEKYGDEELKREFLPRFAAGEVEGCMDLTEPQAGSDLGGILTRATDQPDGTVRVDGQKIYITNGGAEVHLVLARDAEQFEASKGTTNGLSLILVPRHLRDGSRNQIRVARLEEKLGIHGSPTCEVVFEGATGYRVGKPGLGFRAMLDLMNASRLGVSAQALGLSQAAFYDALAYASERRQFGIPIIEQPLVKNMLARIAVNIEAVRGLLYHTVDLTDRVSAREQALARGDLAAGDAAELQAENDRDTQRVRLLTPLVKYFSTQICDEVTRDALQVFGGIGFTLDSNAGKYHADSLILTIYEGTSEIQASFALKEMGKGALGVLFEETRRELAAMGDDAARAPLAQRVEQAIGTVEKAATALFSDIHYALLRAKLMSQMVIDVVAATELLRVAAFEPGRLELAEAFVLRRVIEIDEMARRIDENAEGRSDRDARVLAEFAA